MHATEEKVRDYLWIRTCQECGHKQPSKPPASYKGGSWTEVKCRKCKSIALDYGQEVTPTPEEPSQCPS